MIGVVQWPDGMIPHPVQPETKLRWNGDGVTIYRTHFPVAGAHVIQHAHDYDHVSTLAAGSVRAFADGKDLGIIEAPDGIVIKAGVQHRFEILEPDTILDCIHSGHRLEVE